MTKFVVVCGQMFSVDIEFSLLLEWYQSVDIHWYVSIDDIQGTLTKKFDLFLIAIMYNARKAFPLFVFLPVLQYMQLFLAHLLEAFPLQWMMEYKR